MRHTNNVGNLTFALLGANGGYITYTLDQAFGTIWEYCFGDKGALTYTNSQRQGWPLTPLNGAMKLYGYRTYDCISGSPGRYISEKEFFISLGLNSGFGSRGSFVTTANEAFAVFDEAGRVPSLESTADFEYLNFADLASAPSITSTAYPLWSAWNFLTQLHGTGPTVAHKVLHHKWPSKAPLWDEVVGAFYGGNSWQRIHSLLNDQLATLGGISSGQAITELTEDFNCAVNALHHQGLFPWAVPLTKLRILDILVWTFLKNYNSILMPQRTTQQIIRNLPACCC